MKQRLEYPTVTGPLMANTHPGSCSGQDAYNDMPPVLLNSSGGGYSSNPGRKLLQRSRCKKRKGTGIHRYRITRKGDDLTTMPYRKYRVRRLTPLECSRLQGLPDGWGTPVEKPSMTEEEVAFWNKVRATRAAMDGKKARVLNERQTVRWYSLLQTDSSEYRMYGNGIALPNASFVLDRIAKALRGDPL